jgi:VanZ family protein
VAGFDHCGRVAGMAASDPVLRLSRFLFWSAAIFAFVMAALPQPPPVPGAPSDKVLHVLAFTALGLLGSVAYPRLSPVKLVFGLSAFGGLIELVQLIPSLHRDAELMDWIADTAAVATIVVAIRLWRRSRLAEG